jgi:hypothetical protein
MAHTYLTTSYQLDYHTALEASNVSRSVVITRPCSFLLAAMQLPAGQL